MPARRLEVRITYCCCCGLTVAVTLIAIYSLIVYLVFLGLASWQIDKIHRGVQEATYQDTTPVGIATIDINSNTRIVIDPYFDSLGWYTEEIKYRWEDRYPVLWFNIVVFCFVLIGAILLLVALCTTIQWLLVPYMIFLIVDIIRGIASCIVIFVLSKGDIRKIAVGIFFLGMQLFHISLVMIVFAKFQRMQNKLNGRDYKVVERQGEKSILVDGSNNYPTLPSQYAYSSSPQYRREGYVQPDYNTYAGERRLARTPYAGQQPPPPPGSSAGYYNQGYANGNSTMPRSNPPPVARY